MFTDILSKEYLVFLCKVYQEVRKKHLNNPDYDINKYLKEKVWAIADNQFIYNSSLDSRFEPDFYFRGIDDKGNNLYKFSEYNENLIPVDLTPSIYKLLETSVKSLAQGIERISYEI